MSQTVVVRLAPLLAIAAMALLPAVAEASPHVYVNGAKRAEGKAVHEITWGLLKFTSKTVGAGECHVVGGASMENPKGGGAAVGRVQAFSPYECVVEGCTTQGGRFEETAEELPWTEEVTEPEAGVFRLRTGNKMF